MGESLIHLVRHAQAEPESDSSDPLLTAAGREQASLLGARISARPVALIAHGPAARATDTARLVASQVGLAATQWTELADRTPVPRPDERANHSDRRLAWFDAVPEDEVDVGGAAIEDAYQRLTELARPDGEIFAITHAFVVARMIQQVLDASDPLWMEFDVANAGITTIARIDDGRWRLKAFNDTAHLGG